VGPPEEFTYARAGITDPFSDRLQEETPPATVAGAAGGGVAPDPNRPREALEAFPFDSLRMVGTLARGQQLWALVRAPDETISRIAPGNYLGQNHGRVTSVEQDVLHAVEIIPSGSGGWIEREASLAIAQQP
jgi:type IV pilus assembly protein PilP